MPEERTMLTKNSAMRRTLLEICIVSRFLNMLVKRVYNIKQEFSKFNKVIGSRLAKVEIKTANATFL